MKEKGTGIDWRKEERVQAWLDKHVDPVEQDVFMDDADALLEAVTQIALAKARERVEDRLKYHENYPHDTAHQIRANECRWVLELLSPQAQTGDTTDGETNE